MVLLNPAAIAYKAVVYVECSVQGSSSSRSAIGNARASSLQDLVHLGIFFLFVLFSF